MLADLGERIYNEGIEKGRIEGIETGVEKGRKEGIETGVEKGRIEVVRNMLSNGLDVEQIARFTGLSLSTVTQIKEKS